MIPDNDTCIPLAWEIQSNRDTDPYTTLAYVEGEIPQASNTSLLVELWGGDE